MTVAIGADHAGFELKEQVKRILANLGHEVIDFGTSSTESVDYPDFGLKVAHAVADHKARFGITICGSGNGMQMAANKVKGIRAGLAVNADMAYMTRLHNDANVLSLSRDYTNRDELEQIVKNFLTTDFEGGRHERRIAKITAEEDSH
jgi:ribose 5-phosphate isomerase B